MPSALPCRSCLFSVVFTLALVGCQGGIRGSEEGALPDPGDEPAGTPAPGGTLLYVGTSSGDPEEGIHTLRFAPDSGEGLTRASAVEPVLNPSFLALSPEARFLYATSEGEDGEISAYRVDAETGALTFLNRQPSGGAGPAYVSVDQTGEWVLAANYGGGSVALLPVQEGGRLGEAADVVQHEGSGPNPDRQEGPHAHYIHAGPDNRYAYATDLGTDQVHIYRLDAEAGRLRPAEASPVTTAAGAGPRHLDFHPSGRYVYLVNELDGTVTAYEREAATGGLTALQTVSALPDGFEGNNKSADLHVHPSGRWLYVSNRGDADGIAVFDIDEATGELSSAGYQTQNIRWPRNFALDPTGAYLLVANRRANEVTVFRVDQDTGQLTPTDQRIAVPEPTNITFLAPAG